MLNVDGESLTEGGDEKNERIFGHFNNLLNQQTEIAENIEDYLPIRRARVELERDFSEEEIFLALGRMKNNKAVGVDEVPIELLNYYETEEVGKQIRMIMNNALNSGNVESILKNVRIKVLFKKGMT